MTTFLHTETYVYHMEPDLYINGNILFSDNCALKTTDGTTTITIAGHATICDFYNGIGTLARFKEIFGFRQISPTEVVVLDGQHHCLRLLNRITLMTTGYAGSCESGGYSDGTVSAKFMSPRSVIDDFKHPGMLIVTDSLNHAIRNVNKLSASNPHPVSTFFRDSSSLTLIRGIAQDIITGDMYIVTHNSITKLEYSTKSVSTIAGEYGLHGRRDCDLTYSTFNDPHDVILIGSDSLLLADTYNRKLRQVSLHNNAVTSLCSGVESSSDGDMQTCALSYPRSLMVLDGSLYVGERARIRKIQGKT